MPEMKNKFKKAKRLYLCIVCAVLLLAGCASDTVPNEDKSDGKTVETVYVEAYNNTAVLENYSMEAQISLRKLLFEAKVSGIVKKQDGAYTGTAVLKPLVGKAIMGADDMCSLTATLAYPVWSTKRIGELLA